MFETNIFTTERYGQEIGAIGHLQVKLYHGKLRSQCYRSSPGQTTMVSIDPSAIVHLQVKLYHGKFRSHAIGQTTMVSIDPML